MNNSPVSALCSIYSGTKPTAFANAISSLLSGIVLPSEIIVSVDGPISPGLEQALSAFCKRYSFIKAIRFPLNRGLGASLHDSLYHCQYPYILRFDTDDINLPERLFLLHSTLTQNPRLVVIGSYISEVLPLSKFGNRFTRHVPLEDHKIRKTSFFRNPFNHASVLFRKDSILQVGSYDPVLYFEDYYLWLKLFSYFKQGYHFKNIPFQLVDVFRESLSDRRLGVKYIICESRFYIKALTERTMPLASLGFFIIRIALRLLPFQSLINQSLPWRK
jgi:glycosyltransferase involved in cell wall biosynthesis